MPKRKTNTSKYDYIKLITAYSLFALGPIFIKRIDLPPLTLLWCVLSINVIAIILISRISRAKIRKPTKHLTSLGLVHLFALSAMFTAVSKLEVSMAVLIFQVAPIIILIISPIWIKEHETWKSVVAGVMGIIGIIILLGNDVSSTSFGTGIFIALIAAFFLAAEVILRREIRHLDHINTVTTAFWQQFFIVTFLIPFVDFGMIKEVSTSEMLLILLFGVQLTVSMLLMTSGMKQVQAHHAGVISYVSPFQSIFLAIILLGESLTIEIILGGILIITAGMLEMTESSGARWHKKLKPLTK